MFLFSNSNTQQTNTAYLNYFVQNSRLLVILVGKVPVYREEGSGSIPGRTNT